MFCVFNAATAYQIGWTNNGHLWNNQLKCKFYEQNIYISDSSFLGVQSQPFNSHILKYVLINVLLGTTELMEHNTCWWVCKVEFHLQFCTSAINNEKNVSQASSHSL